MSEEELNQELSTDELKDVSGGFLSGCGKAQIKGDLKTGNLSKKDRKQKDSPGFSMPNCRVDETENVFLTNDK